MIALAYILAGRNTPLSIRLVFVYDAMHRPYGAVIFPFVDQDCEHLPRRLIGKTSALQQVFEPLPFLAAERPG